MFVVISSDVEVCNSENMMKISTFTNILFPLVVTVFCIIPQCLTALSDKQLCYDPNCSEVISLAKTILAYRANDREIMSFGINIDVKVFSKGAGKRTDLWGVEINGQRGFAPKSFLNEYKVLQRVLSYEVPVYKFNDEVHKVQSKLETSEKIHKPHLLNEKLPHNDNEEQTFVTKSLDKNIEDEKVESEKLESAEKIYQIDSSSTNKLPYDDNEMLSLPVESLDKTAQSSEMVDVDSISPSYEVIDGTTLHFDNKPSVQPSFVTDTVHTTALPNKEISHADFKTAPNDSSDKAKFAKNNEVQLDTNDINNIHKEIKSSVDIPKETGTEILAESSEAIINSAIDTASNNDTLSLTKDNELEDKPLNNIAHEEKLVADNTEENIIHSKTETVVEENENESIFSSFAKKFNFLSDTVEAVTTESSINQNSNEAIVPEATVEHYSRLDKKILDNTKIEDVVIEENIPTTESVLYSSITPSVTNKNNIEVQQTKISDGKIKLEEEKIGKEVFSKDTTSDDVPSSSNFVHEDAKDLPTASSVLVNDSSASAETDISSQTGNINVQNAREEEKAIESIKHEDLITSLEEESAISSNTHDIVASKNIQSSNDIEQTLLRNDETYLKNTKEDIHKETIVQIDEVAAVDRIPEISSLPSVEKVSKNIEREIFLDGQTVEKSTVIIDGLNRDAVNTQLNKEIVYNDVNKNDNLMYDANSGNVPIESNEFSNSVKHSILSSEQSADSSQESMISGQTSNEYFNDQHAVHDEGSEYKNSIGNQISNSIKDEDKTLIEHSHISKDKVLSEDDTEKDSDEKESQSKSTSVSYKVSSFDSECTSDCTVEGASKLPEVTSGSEDHMIDGIKLDHNYWKTLMYLGVTAFTTLVFTLGYYYIENIRRDGQLIARINKLEKELLVSTKECEVLSENLKSTKEKLHSIEDESFGSNEMVALLKVDLEMSQNTKDELEEQVTMLEKDLESATEAGLELERMLREVLSSNNEVNPLAQSVGDLHARLDAQQAANESLTNALNLKAQEIETLSVDLVTAKKKYDQLEIELLQVRNELDAQINLKNNIEKTLTDKMHCMEMQIKDLSTEKTSLHRELRSKEIEMKELVEVINQVNSNNLDLEKLYDVSHVKTEAVQLREERDELKTRLNDVEGAHQLLEEHMKLVKEEIAALSDQCKIAEKEKKDAETRLEVLSKFFKEKEAERQKEEAIWLQKQGEVVSTVERIHTMQNEIQNYKQQIEMLKREIVDQEREYKNQISTLETKAHEQWVAARQNERRMEEMKAEAGQLRNRLTLAEKNLNDSDSETKLHRLETNGETATSTPLFLGVESSSSPVMFSGLSNVPPPPPSYLHCFPPYLPPLPPTASGLPPYDISQRPPPLGGRLSSPPPMPPLHPPASGGRYENAGSPPPPMSPHLLPPFNRHRSPPPPFGGDHIPPPPPPGSILPPPIGTAHPWGEESLPPLRNSGFHPPRREQPDDCAQS